MEAEKERGDQDANKSFSLGPRAEGQESFKREVTYLISDSI